MPGASSEFWPKAILMALPGWNASRPPLKAVFSTIPSCAGSVVTRYPSLRRHFAVGSAAWRTDSGPAGDVFVADHLVAHVGEVRRRAPVEEEALGQVGLRLNNP